MAGRSAQRNRSLPRATQEEDSLRVSLLDRGVVRRFGRQGSCRRMAQHRLSGTLPLADPTPDRLYNGFPTLRSALRRPCAQNSFPAARRVLPVIPVLANSILADMTPWLFGKLYTQNINPFNCRRFGEQFGCLRHERFGYRTIQMSLATAFVSERVEH